LGQSAKIVQYCKTESYTIDSIHRDNDGTYLPWQANEPMVTAHPEVCHGLAQDATVRDGNAFSVGDTITIDLYGSASHNGGHCTFWYSTDDETFTKIIDIVDCTLNGAQVVLPTTMPTECETKCTFAFSWVPVSSGACEIYMNCADISVAGASGGNSNPITKNFQTEIIDLGSGNGYGCERVDESTHWTDIFMPLKTDYDDTDTNPTGDEVSIGNDAAENLESATCYSSPELAINRENDFDTDGGRCGNGDGDYRCDDGQCCSAAGYCGPDWNGQAYINYDSTSNGYYSSSVEAFATYCPDNRLGDWRIDDDCSKATKYPCLVMVQVVAFMMALFLLR